MALLELLRFLRDKATTPTRIIGLVSAYLCLALWEGSDLYQPFLDAHREIVSPVAGLGMLYWMAREFLDWINGEGYLPATQRDLLKVSRRVDTIAERQTRLADTIGEAYWETDATGRMIFTNYANARLYGTTARELIRSGTAPYIHQGDVDDAYRQFHQAIQGRMGFSIEFDVVYKGVAIRAVRVYAWPLMDDDDTFIGHYGSAEVIQEYGEDGDY